MKGAICDWQKQETQQARDVLSEKDIAKGDCVVYDSKRAVYLGIVWLDRQGALAAVAVGTDDVHLCHVSFLTKAEEK